MRVNLEKANLSLVNIFENPNQIITIDANFLIPPDRSRYAKKSFNFALFKKVWIEPIFNEFPKLAIHESVYDELVGIELRSYVENLRQENPPKIIIHFDSELTEIEMLLRDTVESRIYPYTNYDPQIDNKDDRGEVKSLSYIAVKGLLYFAAHDNNALQLIEKAEEWSTGLDNVRAIHMFELIYYLYLKNKEDKKSLRMLYKYQYFLTEHEKRTNPEWGDFINQMNDLYEDYSV